MLHGVKAERGALGMGGAWTEQEEHPGDRTQGHTSGELQVKQGTHAPTCLVPIL